MNTIHVQNWVEDKWVPDVVPNVTSRSSVKKGAVKYLIHDSFCFIDGCLALKTLNNSIHIFGNKSNN
jgi:hypothetical protein